MTTTEKTLGTISRKEFLRVLAEAPKNNNELISLLFERCKTDFNSFCDIFFPHYCVLPPSESQIETRASYVFGERGMKRARAKPRGYAKTTDAVLKIVHDICYCLERYIIVASNTEDQAVQKLKDIRSELRDNRMLIHVYGPFFTSRVQGATEFIVEGKEEKIKLQAVGSKKEIRGMKFGEFRPTKILLDDFEDSVEVESERMREKYHDIFREVFAKLGNKKTNYEVVGTMMHKRSLLADICESPEYKSDVYPAIIEWSPRQDLWNKWKKIYNAIENEDHLEKSEAFYRENEKEMLRGTKVLWPEHESYLDLQKELVNDGKKAFYKEKMNAPLSDQEKIFDLGLARWFKDDGEFIELNDNGDRIRKKDMRVIGAMDPATGQQNKNSPKGSDYTCIVTGYLDEYGRLFIANDWTKRAPPSEFIKKLFDLDEAWVYTKFCVETNLFRNLLVKNIRDYEAERYAKKRNRQKLKIMEIHNTEKKEQRIHTIEPYVSSGKIAFSENLSKIFLNQFDDFPKADHDDCPDAVEMLWRMTKAWYPVGNMERR